LPGVGSFAVVSVVGGHCEGLVVAVKVAMIFMASNGVLQGFPVAAVLEEYFLMTV